MQQRNAVGRGLWLPSERCLDSTLILFTTFSRNQLLNTLQRQIDRSPTLPQLGYKLIFALSESMSQWNSDRVRLASHVYPGENMA